MYKRQLYGHIREKGKTILESDTQLSDIKAHGSPTTYSWSNPSPALRYTRAHLASAEYDRSMGITRATAPPPTPAATRGPTATAPSAAPASPGGSAPAPAATPATGTPASAGTPLTPSDAQSYALGHSDIEEVDHRILEFLKARFANPRTARSMALKAHQSGRELLRELHKINAVVMAKGSGEDYINGEQRRLEAAGIASVTVAAYNNFSTDYSALNDRKARPEDESRLATLFKQAVRDIGQFMELKVDAALANKAHQAVDG